MLDMLFEPKAYCRAVQGPTADLYLDRENPCRRFDKAFSLALLRHVREGIRVSCRAVNLMSGHVR